MNYPTVVTKIVRAFSLIVQKRGRKNKMGQTFFKLPQIHSLQSWLIGETNLCTKTQTYFHDKHFY